MHTEKGLTKGQSFFIVNLTDFVYTAEISELFLYNTQD